MEKEIKDNETVDLKTIIVRYMRQWKLFLAVFILSFIPAVLYLTFYPRTYEFMARIQVQEDAGISPAGFGLGEAAGIMKSFGISGGSMGSVNIEDEISILSSSRIISRMILELGLNVEYTEPYSFYRMYREAPLKLTMDSTAMLRLDDQYKFTVAVARGKINVKVKSRLGKRKARFTYSSLPAKIAFDGQEFTLDFDNDGSADRNFKLKIVCMPANWLAESFADEFLIEEISKSSNVIELGCTDHVRERGKAMLDVLMQKYNEDAAVFKRAMDNQIITFVDERIEGVISELRDVERSIEAYKEKNQMTLLESDVLFYTEQMKELQVRMIEIEAQLRLISMMDEYVKDPENKYNVIPSLLSVAEGEKGSAIGLYNEAILERDRLLKNSNESNPAFKSMSAQVDKLRDGVYLMIENAEKTCRETLTDLKSKEKILLDRMK
ncbi:MAG: tyrosine protein kinase, partial [Tannerella sp.]|nr:tyrosine protein kinase [Tannerella sp.]